MIISPQADACFFVTSRIREFVSAGGELMIHGALHLKNFPIPEINIDIQLQLVA